MGIKLCMQPNFSQDSSLYEDRVCGKYCEQNNPFRMLIDEVGYMAGKDLIFGSDGMPHGAENALQYSLFPPYSSQILSIEEFVAGYCMEDFSYGFVEVEINKKAQKIVIQDCEICK